MHNVIFFLHPPFTFLDRKFWATAIAKKKIIFLLSKRIKEKFYAIMKSLFLLYLAQSPHQHT